MAANDFSSEVEATVGTFRVEPPVRQRVADHVFEALARAILNGELRAGSPLATQRDLAKQFGVSALVVRQAIHRLEDLTLVRVRQGSTTVVLDPNESSDIRLIQLRIELSAPESNMSTEALEMRALFLVPLLSLAERRITAEELSVLNYLIDNVPADPSTEQVQRFLGEYVRLIAKAARNPVLEQQVRWWLKMAGELERRGRNLHSPRFAFNREFYRNVSRALAAGHGAAQLHLESLQPLLEWIEKQRGVGVGVGAKRPAIAADAAARAKSKA